MTSKLTGEKAQWLHDACEEAAAAVIKLTMNPNELLMFTSYVLAAMDSEPVAWLNDACLARGVVDGEAGSEDAGPGYIPVYREAVPQSAPQC